MMSRREESTIIYDEQNHRRKKIEDELAHLPQELIIEKILTKLPARSLAVFSCVGKFWYDLIFNDTLFAEAHFLQNKNKYNLVFNLLNVHKNSWEHVVFFGVENGSRAADDDEFLDSKIVSTIRLKNLHELVGYCNGLACVKLISEDDHADGVITVINPNRSATLSLPYLIPNGGSCRFLCHGFGFDSLSQEYKAVVIYTSIANDEFICMVVTLGTKTWRTIVTSTAEMSPPPGCSSFPSRMVTKVSTSIHRQATLCGGHLFWRITNRLVEEDNDSNIEMLLSFNIHNEKIQFVRFPDECKLSPMNDHQFVEVDHHLVEFKGYLCVARSEKIMVSNRYHHLRRHQCNEQRRFCRCRFKVHLYILKDKVKQVWEKGETFDIQMKDEGLPAAAPFCCCSGTTTDTNSTTTTTAPTRILSFSDQMLLYWFDGGCLIFYHLQMKHLKVVKCSRSCNKRNRAIFKRRMKGISSGRSNGEDDNPSCPYMDYQLHAQVENIHSMKTFIPEGATSEFKGFESFDSLDQSIKNKLPAGVVCTGRTLKYYSFYS